MDFNCLRNRKVSNVFDWRRFDCYAVRDEVVCRYESSSAYDGNVKCECHLNNAVICTRQTKHFAIVGVVS